MGPKHFRLHPFHHLGRSFCRKEWQFVVLHPFWVIGCPRGSHLLEISGRCPVRIISCLQDIRRLRRKEDDLRHSAPVPCRADVPNDFPATHGMADQDCVSQIEPLNYGTEIIRQGVQIVAMRRSVRPAMTAAVITDTANAVIAEKRLLVTPHRAGKALASERTRRAGPIPIRDETARCRPASEFSTVPREPQQPKTERLPRPQCRQRPWRWPIEEHFVFA